MFNTTACFQQVRTSLENFHASKFSKGEKNTYRYIIGYLDSEVPLAYVSVCQSRSLLGAISSTGLEEMQFSLTAIV